jgi:magnesium-transporting ATPase (P-type)
MGGGTNKLASSAVAGTGSTASTAAGGPQYHAMTVEEVYAALNTSENGLSKPEAATRLTKYGKNTMTRGKHRTLLHIIWANTNSIITYILAVSAIISGIFQEWIELGFIVAVLLINIGLGTYQEASAEKKTRAISAMVSASALVMRNNRRVTVDASTLVPGDVVFLASGDKIPADVRFFDTSNLQVTESMLTGESVPISKDTEAVADDAPLGDRTCLGFSGTLVFTGQGSGVVVATGDSAQIGNINKLMSTVEVAKTPLLQQIEGFGFAMSIICILVALITFFVAYWGRNLDLKDAFAAAISVAVALIPEGLATVVTITLAMGITNMAKAKAIIRQLPAVETLGALTTICSDKTGE